MSSNYPNGFLDGVTIRGLPLQQLHPGEVFWVNNSSVLAPVKSALAGSDGNNGSYKEPFSTVDFAIGKCKASRGDIIVVMPGHAEDLGVAGAISSDVAGVAVIGLGTGALRPTFTCSVTAGSWDMSAANLSFYNLLFLSSIIDNTGCHQLTGAADNVTWEYCTWQETTVNLNWIDVIVAATGANQLEWNNCQYYGLDAQNDSFFKGVAHVGFRMNNCYIAHDVAQASVVGQLLATGNVTDVWIKNSVFRSWVDGAKHIDFAGSACSGSISGCYMSNIDTVGAVLGGVTQFTGGHVFQCYVAGEPDTWGIVGGGVIYGN